MEELCALSSSSFIFFQFLPILATRYLCLLICTSLLAPAALLAFDIKNLHLCNGTLDEIMNLHPESFQLGKYTTVTGRGRQSHVQ